MGYEEMETLFQLIGKSCLKQCSPAQYVLFIQEWKDTAAILAMDNLQNIYNTLNGDGLFVTIAQQITIPSRGLAQVADVVRAAWLKTVSYTHLTLPTKA